MVKTRAVKCVFKTFLKKVLYTIKEYQYVLSVILKGLLVKSQQSLLRVCFSNLGSHLVSAHCLLWVTPCEPQIWT